jgi:Thioredoxin-like
MKSVLLFSAMLMVATQFSCTAQTETAPANGLEWHTDLAKARAVSEATKKPIFGFFTGSDWCGWCHRLQANVFAKPARRLSDHLVVLCQPRRNRSFQPQCPGFPGLSQWHRTRKGRGEVPCRRKCHPPKRSRRWQIAYRKEEEQVARLVLSSCGSQPMYPFEHVWDLVLALVKDRLISGASIGDIEPTSA